MIPPSRWRLTRYFLWHKLLRCLFAAGVAQRFSLLYSGSSFMRFRIYTQRRTTIGRTSLDEGPAHRKDLYLTTHNTHNRQTSMPPVGFEPTIPAGEQSQTYALDRTATGTGFTAIGYSHCLFAKRASQSFSFDSHFLLHWKDSNKCRSTLTFALFFCNDVIDWKKDPFFFFSLQKRTGCCNKSFILYHPSLGWYIKRFTKAPSDPHFTPVLLFTSIF